MSAAERNVDVVRRLFGAFERKQGFALRDVFAPDATWVVPGGSTMAGTLMPKLRAVFLEMV